MTRQIQLRHRSVLLICGLALSAAGLDKQASARQVSAESSSLTPQKNRVLVKAVPDSVGAGKGMEHEEILVHGSRGSAARLEHTGVAISRLDHATLAQAGVTTINDLQRLVPNLQVENAFGGGQPQFHLRGVGFFDYGSNNMPDVMTYVDGVAYPFGIMTQGVMFDVSEVEVERGPTGATSVVTRRGAILIS